MSGSRTRIVEATGRILRTQGLAVVLQAATIQRLGLGPGRTDRLRLRQPRRPQGLGSARHRERRAVVGHCGSAQHGVEGGLAQSARQVFDEGGGGMRCHVLASSLSAGMAPSRGDSERNAWRIRVPGGVLRSARHSFKPIRWKRATPPS